MNTVLVRFVGPDPVEIDLSAVDSDIPGLRQVVKPGDVLEVAYEIAHGRDGATLLDDDGEPVLNPDTGEAEVENRYGGLLDQPAKWALAKRPRARKGEKSTAPDQAPEAPVATEKED